MIKPFYNFDITIIKSNPSPIILSIPKNIMINLSLETLFRWTLGDFEPMNLALILLIESSNLRISIDAKWERVTKSLTLFSP